MADKQLADLITEGVFASRPAAADAVEYYATDTKVRYYSDGASWTAQPPTVETHVHSGSDITSGTVADARIDSALTRDSEAAAAYSAIGHDHDGTPDAKLAQANTHESPDTDSGTSSLHHTIGTGANQAAAGNHSHAGALAQAYVGKNAVGASLETLVTKKWLLKKVTLPYDCLITNIEASLKASTDKVDNFVVALFADSSGSPKELLAVGGGVGEATVLLLTHAAATAGAARWFGKAIGRWCAAGDYWLGVSVSTDADIALQIAYDTSGSDKNFTTGGIWVTDAGYTTVNTGTNDYSIRANTIR